MAFPPLEAPQYIPSRLMQQIPSISSHKFAMEDLLEPSPKSHMIPALTCSVSEFSTALANYQARNNLPAAPPCSSNELAHFLPRPQQDEQSTIQSPVIGLPAGIHGTGITSTTDHGNTKDLVTAALQENELHDLIPSGNHDSNIGLEPGENHDNHTGIGDHSSVSSVNSNHGNHCSSNATTNEIGSGIEQQLSNDHGKTEEENSTTSTSASNSVEVKPASSHSNSTELTQLVHNPMFGDLQATLATDCVLQSVPYTLVHSSEEKNNITNQINTDLFIEDATLQAEFRQLKPLGNHKVSELETFYNTQSATVLKDRTDALAFVHQKNLPEQQVLTELATVNQYYDEQQGHLTQRISRSLQLLKQALPREQAHPGGGIKRTKSRLLNPTSVAIMNDWYEQHQSNPYPTEEEKNDIAKRGGITVTQVKAWFANKRNRSLNTKPKREKHKLQKQLAKICETIKHSEPECHGNLESQDSIYGSGKASANHNYHLLMDNFSTMVEDRTWEIKQMTQPMFGSMFGGQVHMPLPHY